MRFSRQEYWSGLPFPSPGDFPDPGIKPRSPALQAEPLSHQGTINTQVKEGLSEEVTFALNPKWEKSVQAKGMARFRVLRTKREADGELISRKERRRPMWVFNDSLLIVLLPEPCQVGRVKVFDYQQKCLQSSLYTRLSSLEYSWEQNRHSPC